MCPYPLKLSLRESLPRYRILPYYFAARNISLLPPLSRLRLLPRAGSFLTHVSLSFVLGLQKMAIHGLEIKADGVSSVFENLIYLFYSLFWEICGFA